ncbi:MAG: hypothetical protein HFI63_11520 [Lachnospiraceae bacterium]|nr:hypothetical protein [Lachnospiraceae bacterium]
MKKVTCVSYHSSGSSAVVDYIKEFKNVSFPQQEVECRFLQDPDGISDLEFQLIDNWHRLNSGFAIKRFEQFAKRYHHHYSLLFGKNWAIYAQKYADSLKDFTFNGYWHCDISIFPVYMKAYYYMRRAINRIMPEKLKKKPDYNYFPGAVSYHSHLSKEEFYRNTRLFVENLCKSVFHDRQSLIILDQFVSTTNIKRYMNYAEDLKVILVDRDPRDVYIEEQHIDDHVLPVEVQLFAKQFSDMRIGQAKEILTDNVLKIQFEDMLYKYEETTRTIRDFLELDEKDHINKFKYFNPKNSIRNTKLWERYPGYDEEMKILQSLAGDYFYFT